MNETITTGWQSSPDGRGTFDVVKSCGITILLCCWTTVQPNIGAMHDSWAANIRDKAGMACLALLGPEFMLFHASGQRDSARESVKAFKAKGVHHWTRKMAFYADMGGFRVVAPDYTFPVDARQLLFLIDRKYVELPELSDEDIDDKNKQDSVARLVTLLQALWFVCNTLSRVIQKLPITALELTTVSFIIVTFASSYMWMQKPMDVHRSIPISSSTPAEQMRREAGVEGPWIRSPLEFASEPDSEIYNHWRFFNEILHKAGLPIFERKITAEPWDRIPHMTWPNTAPTTDILGGMITVCFAGVLILGWNFHFPSEAERLLWRISSVCNVVFCMAGYAWMGANKHIPWLRRKFQRANADAEKGAARPGTMWQRMQAGLQNNSSPRDPALTLAVSCRIPMLGLAMLYCIARALILIQDAAGLRALPESAFQTVQWANYIPHL